MAKQNAKLPTWTHLALVAPALLPPPLPPAVAEPPPAPAPPPPPELPPAACSASFHACLTPAAARRTASAGWRLCSAPMAFGRRDATSIGRVTGMGSTALSAASTISSARLASAGE